MIDLLESRGGVGAAAVSHPSRDRSASQARLVAAMEEVMDAIASGHAIDRESLLAKYADVAEEFFVPGPDLPLPSHQLWEPRKLNPAKRG